MSEKARVKHRARAFVVTAGLALALSPSGLAIADPIQEADSTKTTTTVDTNPTVVGQTTNVVQDSPTAPQTPQTTVVDTPTISQEPTSDDVSNDVVDTVNVVKDDTQGSQQKAVDEKVGQTPTVTDETGKTNADAPVTTSDTTGDAAKGTDKQAAPSTASGTTSNDAAKGSDVAGASKVAIADDGGVETQARNAELKNVSIDAHVQNIGWAGAKNGEAGTTGQSLRTEAFKITLLDEDGNTVKGVSYKTHVQNIGWTQWVMDGDLSGTTGQSLRVEAIKLALSEELAKYYDIVYRVHVQNYGWLDWTSNGDAAGTSGQSLRIEAIGAYLQRKNAAKIGSGKAAFIGNDKGDTVGVFINGHVQNIGWTGLANGVAGTTGQGLRLEAFTAVLDGVSGGISYTTHVQNEGWLSKVSNGAVTGTTGKGLSIEATGFELTGAARDKYDIYYRAHVQNYGWLGWAKNGEGLGAGTQGLSKRMEALQVRLVPKGGQAPSNSDAYMSASFVAPVNVSYSSASGSSWLSQVSNGTMSGNTSGSLLERIKATYSQTVDTTGLPTGSISYQLLAKNDSWSAAKSNGGEAGTLGTDTKGLKMSLSGDLGKAFDVYYRVHVNGKGWLGWAKNGGVAGTNIDSGIDAFGVVLVAKGNEAPSNATSTYATPLLQSGWRHDTIESYLNTAVSIANDNSHGYSQYNRWGPDYDCSSLVVTCLRSAGLNTGGATYTGNMLGELTKYGWQSLPFTSINELQRGDILLNINSHTEFYLGGGKNVAALISELGTIYGAPGDQTGREIRVKDFTIYGNGGWDVVLRLK